MIYCVEDERNIRELLIYTLETTGFKARGFGNGNELMKALKEEIPELILLDIMLPGDDGYTILEQLKSMPSVKDVPVIMVTAKEAEFDKVKGLEGGADDYITKPFGMMEFVARVKAVLRRSARQNEDKELHYDELYLNVGRHEVRYREEKVDLTRKEFELLQYLLENKGLVMTRNQILCHVWGYDFDGETRTVDVHVRTLRQKLGEAGNLIETVRGRIQDRRITDKTDENRSGKMKHKIFSHTSLLIILSVILTFLAAGTVMYNRYDIYMKQGVRDEAAYIKTGLEEDGDVFLSDRIGDATSSRITLLGKDGQVLFDSIENPEEMENHSNRPEFIEAEKQGSGEMVRYSDTLSKQTFYYAVKLKDDQVLRVARTTDSLLVTMLTSSLLLGGLVCVILVIELFLVQKQTRKLIEPINRIDLEHPLEHVCYEELRPLLFRLDQQNRQIQKQLEDLKNAESARKEFTANVSHELKTPLMSISGYAELMMNGMVPPDKMQDFSGRIFHESERLSNLVADIIQLSRLDEKNGETMFEQVDIGELGEDVINNLQNRAAKKKINL